MHRAIILPLEVIRTKLKRAKENGAESVKCFIHPQGGTTQCKHDVPLDLDALEIISRAFSADDTVKLMAVFICEHHDPSLKEHFIQLFLDLADESNGTRSPSSRHHSPADPSKSRSMVNFIDLTTPPYTPSPKPRGRANPSTTTASPATKRNVNASDNDRLDEDVIQSLSHEVSHGCLTPRVTPPLKPSSLLAGKFNVSRQRGESVEDPGLATRSSCSIPCTSTRATLANVTATPEVPSDRASAPNTSPSIRIDGSQAQRIPVGSSKETNVDYTAPASPEPPHLAGHLSDVTGTRTADSLQPPKSGIRRSSAPAADSRTTASVRDSRAGRSVSASDIFSSATNASNSDAARDPPDGNNSGTPNSKLLSPNRLDEAIKEAIKQRVGTVEGYVYIFSCLKHKGLVKIGKAKNVEQRMDQLRTQCDLEGLKEEGTINHQRIRHYDRLERLVHIELQNYKRPHKCVHNRKNSVIHGEWFEVSPGTAFETVQRWRMFLQNEPYSDDGSLKAKWSNRLHDKYLPRIQSGREECDDHEARNKRWETWIKRSAKIIDGSITMTQNWCALPVLLCDVIIYCRWGLYSSVLVIFGQSILMVAMSFMPQPDAWTIRVAELIGSA